MQRVNFVRGASFIFSGTADNEGSPNFTGWTISGAIFDKATNGNDPARLADLSAAWVSAAAGTFTMAATPEITAAWSRGTKTLQASLVNPSGDSFKSTVLIVQVIAEGEIL